MPKSNADCRTEFGARVLGSATIAGVEFTFGKPTRDAWRAIQGGGVAVAGGEGEDAVKRATASIEAIEELARGACLSHTPQELEDAAERYYDTLAELGSAVLVAFRREQEKLGKASAPRGSQPPPAS